MGKPGSKFRYFIPVKQTITANRNYITYWYVVLPLAGRYVHHFRKCSAQLANGNPTAQMNKRRGQRQTYEDERDNTFQPLVKCAKQYTNSTAASFLDN
jgi:hypothetical protein